MTEQGNTIYLACKAFIAVYESGATQPKDNAPLKPVQPVNHSVKTSNGIPICAVHDRAMREGQYGYYCSAKEDDPELANDKGYCKYKVKR